MILTKKISENKVTEQVYRTLKERLSYSDLRLYATNRYRFMKERILNEPREQEQTVATLIGDICHVLLSGTEGEFDRKFCISSVAEPTGQVLELCHALYKVDQRYRSTDGTQSQQFETLFKEAVDSIKYDRDLKEVMFKGKNMEKILQLFTEPDKKGACGELFYREMLANTGKTVVSINNITTAEKVVEQLKSHPYTSEIINKRSDEQYEVFNEQVILYNYGNIGYRSMLDKIIVNHKAKKVMMYDYKITWSNEEGFAYSYLKNMYYLQAALYHYSVGQWIIEHNLEGYTAEPMIYIAADVTATSAPVIYKLTEEDIIRGINGFTIGKKKYPGVTEIHQAIQWHLNEGDWTTTSEIRENCGVMLLNIQYENQ